VARRIKAVDVQSPATGYKEKKKRSSDMTEKICSHKQVL
jgi:hypothetical protein